MSLALSSLLAINAYIQISDEPLGSDATQVCLTCPKLKNQYSPPPPPPSTPKHGLYLLYSLICLVVSSKFFPLPCPCTSLITKSYWFSLLNSSRVWLYPSTYTVTALDWPGPPLAPPSRMYLDGELLHVASRSRGSWVWFIRFFSHL